MLQTVDGWDNGAMNVVIVGGTAEARALAGRLIAEGFDVWTTLAGATATRAELPGKVRVGGFGGDAQMAAWLDEIGAHVVVDATHPFAARMTARMGRLAETSPRPIVRLDRPGWASRPDAGTWTWVDSHEAAARAVEAWRGQDGHAARTVLLTVGRQELPAYQRLAAPVVARVVTPPREAPAPWTILANRGPFSLESERALLAEHRVGLLVTKDAGGNPAKLDAAAQAGVEVVMISRPATPPNLPTVADVDEACAWVVTTAAGPRR